MLAALLLAKITIAAEHDVQLVVSEDSHLEGADLDGPALITIVGNLVDNAIEAVSGQAGSREITVQLTEADDGIHIVVSDNGPGIPADKVAEVFTDGYSTKPAAEGMRRGLGLALVHRIVRRAGGSVSAAAAPGARFDVWLPTRTAPNAFAGDRPRVDSAP